MNKDARWRQAAGHMVGASDAAVNLEVIVKYVQDIQKKGMAANLVTDEMADMARDLADQMINHMRNAVTAKRGE